MEAFINETKLRNDIAYKLYQIESLGDREYWFASTETRKTFIEKADKIINVIKENLK